MLEFLEMVLKIFLLIGGFITFVLGFIGWREFIRQQKQPGYEDARELLWRALKDNKMEDFIKFQELKIKYSKSNQNL